MTDTKTSDEISAGALDGTELVRIVQSGVNAKTTAAAFAALAGTQVINVTTGASQTDIVSDDFTGPYTVLKVTSGGTHETEVLNILPLTDEVGTIGWQVVVWLYSQTEDDDVIQILSDSDNHLLIYDTTGKLRLRSVDGGILDDEDQFLPLCWPGDGWYANNTENASSTTWEVRASYETLVPTRTGKRAGDVLQVVNPTTGAVAFQSGPVTALSYDPSNTSGLTFAYSGGSIITAFGPGLIGDGTIDVTDDDATLVYLLVDDFGGITPTAGSGSFPANSIPIATVVAVSGQITSVVDRRAFLALPPAGRPASALFNGGPPGPLSTGSAIALPDRIVSITEYVFTLGAVTDLVDVTSEFALSVSGTIAAFSDNGGGGTTVAISGGNDPDTGFPVTITATTNYNGSFAVSNVVPGVSFDIDTAFTTDDATGDFEQTYPAGYITNPGGSDTSGNKLLMHFTDRTP